MLINLESLFVVVRFCLFLFIFGENSAKKAPDFFNKTLLQSKRRMTVAKFIAIKTGKLIQFVRNKFYNHGKAQN